MPNKRFNQTQASGWFSACHVGSEIEHQSLLAPLAHAG